MGGACGMKGEIRNVHRLLVGNSEDIRLSMRPRKCKITIDKVMGRNGVC
jgi:hypothetical protein